VELPFMDILVADGA
jgi:hypothetical protein